MSLINPCFFLLGLHGAGKTTLGRYLQDKHGWQHISLGDLGRLARSRRLPREFSVRLMGALGAQIPGARLSTKLVDALLDDIQRIRMVRPVSVDGFPCEPYHLSRLPLGSRVVHLHVAEELRLARLEHRSSTTVRQWSTHSSPAPRDRDLPLILEALRGRLIELDSAGPVHELAKKLAQEVINL